MSNVIELSSIVKPNSNIARMAELEAAQAQQGLYYDVIEGEATFTVDGVTKVAENKKALINADTGKLIAYMGMGYHTVTMREMFGALNPLIANSDIDLTGAYSTVRVGYNGARAAVNYVFPEHKLDMGGPHGPTYLQLLVINSFDGSTGLISAFGGLRGYCLNTQVFGEHVGFKRYHNAQLDFDDVARTVTRGIEVFAKEGENWKRMVEAPVYSDDAYKAIMDYCKKETILVPTYSDYQANKVLMGKTRDTKVDNMMRVWEDYARDLGGNEFALFNCLTHVAEHGCAKSGNAEQSLAGVQTRLQAVRDVSARHLTQFKAA
jgi:hypothetical protein